MALDKVSKIVSAKMDIMDINNFHPFSQNTNFGTTLLLIRKMYKHKDLTVFNR